MQEIIVYSSEHCVHCRNLKKWLLESKIDFKEKDVSIEKNKTEFLTYNETGIPLTIIKDKNKEKRILGFSLKEIRKTLVEETDISTKGNL
ncbi:glutaredoxin family protein [Priestia megaterium]|uniref:glutaredoxin family protein n=1 Tax=Priestia megaterium TaxID=1404 RepID=UPI0012B9BA6B|nr:glutaredoxin family protein [Priestia megaterium]QSX24146.1 glutaredoxin family protein [Priestia megaterium]